MEFPFDATEVSNCPKMTYREILVGVLILSLNEIEF